MSKKCGGCKKEKSLDNYSSRHSLCNYCVNAIKNRDNLAVCVLNKGDMMIVIDEKAGFGTYRKGGLMDEFGICSDNKDINSKIIKIEFKELEIKKEAGILYNVKKNIIYYNNLNALDKLNKLDFLANTTFIHVPESNWKYEYLL